MILSPHTDDAELGCGGSLIKWDNLYVVVFSLCEESIPKEWDITSTQTEFVKSMKMLGCDYELLHFPVRKFDRQETLEYLYELNRKIKPDLVVCPSLNDIHQDHKVVAEEALRIFKCSIIGYESPYNNMSFNPVYYEKLEKQHIDKKIELVNIYKSQIVKNQEYFSDEFIRGLAKVRGVQIKSQYAEAFECYRFVS